MLLKGVLVSAQPQNLGALVVQSREFPGFLVAAPTELVKVRLETCVVEDLCLIRL